MSFAGGGPEEATYFSQSVVRYCSVVPSSSGIGVHLHESDGDGPVTIDQIVPGGQAEKAGLRTGDEVVSIAGHTASSGDLARVLEAVGELSRRRPTEPIEWIVRRRPEGQAAGGHFEEDYTHSVELAWAKNAATAAKEQLAKAVTQHVAEISATEERHNTFAAQTLAVARIAKHWRARRSAIALKSVASAHRKCIEEQKQLAKFSVAEANAVRSLHKQLGDDYLQLRDTLKQTQLDHRAQALRQQGEHARALAAQEHGHEREKAELKQTHSTMLARAEQEASRSTADAKAAQAELDSAQQSISDLLGELAELRVALAAKDAQLTANAAQHEAERQSLQAQLAACDLQHEAQSKELSTEILQLGEQLAAAELRASIAEELQQQGLEVQLKDRVVSVVGVVNAQDQDKLDGLDAGTDDSEQPPALQPESDPDSEMQLNLLGEDIKFVLFAEHQAEMSRLHAESDENLDLLHEMQEQLEQLAIEHDDEMTQAAAKYQELESQLVETKNAHSRVLAENQSTIQSLEQQLKERSASLQSANTAYETAMQQISKDSAQFTAASTTLQSRIAEMETQHKDQVAEFERQIRQAEAEAKEAKQLQLHAEELHQQAKQQHEKEFQATLASRVVTIHGQGEKNAADAGTTMAKVQSDSEPQPEPKTQEIKYVVLHEHEAEVSRLQKERDEHLLQWQDATAMHEEALEEHEQTLAAFNALKARLADAQALHDSALVAVRAELREAELSRQSAAEHHKRRETDQLATVDLLQNDVAAKQRRLEVTQAELETQIQANTSLQIEQDILRRRIVALQASANNEADRAEHLRQQLRDSERACAGIESKLTQEAEASPATYTELIAAVMEVEQQVADAKEMGEPTEPLMQILSELREEVLASQEMAGLRDTLESKEATIVALRADLQENKRALQLVKEDHRVSLAREKMGKELRMKKFLGRMMSNNLQSVFSGWRQATVDALIQRREYEQTEREANALAATEAAAAAAAVLQTRYDALHDETVALRKAALRTDALRKEMEAEQAECARLRNQLADRQASEETAAAALQAANDKLAAAVGMNEVDCPRTESLAKLAQLDHMLEDAEARAPAMPEAAIARQPVTEIRQETVSIRMAQSPKGFGMALSDQLDVDSVAPGSVADKAGVPVSSRIVEVAGIPVLTKSDLLGAVTGSDPGAKILFVFTKLTHQATGEDESTQRELAAARNEIRIVSDKLAACEDKLARVEDKLGTVGIERAEMQKELEALRSAADCAREAVTKPTKIPAKVIKASAAGPSDGTLTLELAQCLGLLPADKNGKSDPYVKVTLGHETYTSKTIFKTLDPVFNESFTFEIKSQVLSSDAWSVRLEVWDKDKGSKDEFLGEATVHLIDAFAGEWVRSGPMEIVLKDPKKRLVPKLVKAVEQRSTGGKKRAPQGSATILLSFEPKSTRKSSQPEPEPEPEPEVRTKSLEHDALVASLCAELQAVQLLALQHSESSKSGDHDAQTAQSAAEVRQLRSTLDIVTAERALLQRAVDSLREGVSTAPEPTAASCSNTQLPTATKDLGGEAMKWEAEFHRVKADLTKSRDDHLATTKQLHTATRHIDELQDELDTERETVVALEADIAELRAVHQEECEVLRAQLDEQLRELASMRAKLDASERARAAEAAKYATEVELLRTEAPASYAELTDAVAEVEQQIADAEASGEPVQQLQQLLSELQLQVLTMEEAAGLREKLAQLTTESQQAQSEQSEMAQLRDALLSLHADSAADQAELDAILVPSPRESPVITPAGSVDGDVDIATLISLAEEGEPPEGNVPELQPDARSVFNELDVDGSGFIDYNDIAVLCQRMGRTQSEEAIRHALTVMDTNHNGEVDWNEFIVWWTWTAQHEEEVALGHRPEDYPNHAFWAKQSLREQDGSKTSLTPQEQRAMQRIDEEELIAEGDAGPPFDGTLEVEVVRCSGLLPADKHGESDPYVKLELGTQRTATTSKSKTLDPVYRERYSFGMQAAKPGDNSRALSLAVEVWNKDRGATDTFLGEVSVSVVEAFSGKWSSATVGPLEYELTDASNRVDPKIAKLVASRIADGIGERQEHGKVVLKFSFQREDAPAAKQKGAK